MKKYMAPKMDVVEFEDEVMFSLFNVSVVTEPEGTEDGGDV